MELSSEFLDGARDSTLVENTAQAVFKHLDRLEDHRTSFGGKWVWELLQNARDAAPPEGVLVQIVLADDRLEFRHDGLPFKPREIAHLIYHGSTKVGGDEDLDHFGSGFLSAHLLSRVVRVQGALADGATFEFDLDRSGATIDDLHDAMERSWAEFKGSITPDAREGGRSTEYVYALAPETLGFARDGLETLRRIGHLALAFSPELRGIEIRTDSGSWTFARGERERLTDRIEMLRVECRVDDRAEMRHIAIAKSSDEVEAVLPLSELEGRLTADLDKGTPRFFVVFPLVTTERLPLPAVVNSKRFKPREDRDGIVLGGGTERIAENRQLLERSAELILQLLAQAAASKWRGLEQLVSYETSELPDWVDRDWFLDYLRRLIEATRRIPLLATDEGRWIPPEDSWIPSHDEARCRESLWGLSSSWANGSMRLPRRDHAERWYQNLASWRALIPEDELPETFTIRRLTELVDETATVDDLGHALVAQDDPLAWLRSLLGLIHEGGGTPLLDQRKVLPSQAGTLRRRSELRYDEGIGDELKDIAQDFGVPIRAQLLDARAATPEGVDLLTPKSEEEALEEALEALARSCEEERLPLHLARPNASLFWWLVHSPPHRHRLDGYPVVTSEEPKGPVLTFSLRRDRDRAPLAPSLVWPESARAFASLFPRRKILHDLLAAPDVGATPEGWESLEAEGYVRMTPIFRTSRPLQRFLAEAGLRERDDESHRSSGEVDVSDIAFLSEEDIGLIDTARKSKPRALQLIEFLLTSVMNEDTTAFHELSVQCDCGENHSAYSAAWLIPMHDRKWVPATGGRATLVSAESLGGLLSERPVLVELLGTDQGANLLHALDVSPADFQLRAVATEEIDRLRLVRSMSELARAAGGNLHRIEMLATEIREHPEIIQDVEDARERRAKVQSNQRLGQLVEDLLEEVLAAHGLTVRRTGVGSDFEVESDFTEGGQEVVLEIGDGQRSVLIEVKSARSERVRMTPTQAILANREQGRFALCVVPLDTDSPTHDAVRQACRFVFDIGRLLHQPMQDYLSVVTATKGARRQGGQIDVEIAEGQVRFAVSEEVWLDGLAFDSALAAIASRG